MDRVKAAFGDELVESKFVDFQKFRCLGHTQRSDLARAGRAIGVYSHHLTQQPKMARGSDSDFASTFRSHSGGLEKPQCYNPAVVDLTFCKSELAVRDLSRFCCGKVTKKRRNFSEVLLKPLSNQCNRNNDSLPRINLRFGRDCG
jgi:hypothetical protein